MTWKVLSLVSLLYLSLFVLPGTAQFARFSGYSRPRELRLFNAKNRAIKDVNYHTKTASSYVTCGRDCSAEKECKSFNFYKCPKLCELNNSTRSDYPEAFVEDQGAVYFDGNEETPLSSLPDDPVHLRGSCKELMEAGYHTNGVFKIYPARFVDGLDVHCDMEIDGGGWIVFQEIEEKQDSECRSDRSWAAYKFGFSDQSRRQWLGNDNLLRLTSDSSHGTWELRIDFAYQMEGVTAFAKYTNLTITGEKYTLDFDAYDVSSTAGDCLRLYKGTPFSTYDNDNDAMPDVNCAEYHNMAWWFNTCPTIYYIKDSFTLSMKIRETCHE